MNHRVVDMNGKPFYGNNLPKWYHDLVHDIASAFDEIDEAMKLHLEAIKKQNNMIEALCEDNRGLKAELNELKNMRKSWWKK